MQTIRNPFEDISKDRFIDIGTGPIPIPVCTKVELNRIQNKLFLLASKIEDKESFTFLFSGADTSKELERIIELVGYYDVETLVKINQT